jgi:hypothetical protein
MVMVLLLAHRHIEDLFRRSRTDTIVSRKILNRRERTYVCLDDFGFYFLQYNLDLVRVDPMSLQNLLETRGRFRRGAVDRSIGRYAESRHSV